MQLMNLPPDEQLNLEKIVNGHHNVLHVRKEKALFIGFVWVLLIEQILPSFSRSNLC